MMRRRSASTFAGYPVFLLIAMLTFSSSALAQVAPVVTRGSDHFKVSYNGGPAQPKFLLMLAYFGAARRPGSARTGMTPAEMTARLAEVRNDFRIIKLAGFDGVRLFPNWIWSFDKGGDQCDATDPNTLMGVSGVNGTMATYYAQVLTIAGQEQLVVDLTFNMEQVRTIGDTQRLMKPGYRDQLGAIAGLAAGQFRHVIFDLENEANGSVPSVNCVKEPFAPGPGMSLTSPTLLDLRNVTKAPDNGRLVSASLANEASLISAATQSYFSQFDFISYHESRNPWSPAAVATDLANVRGQMAANNIWLPIYYSEPQIAALATTQELWDAACNARRFGAAAWTFHTEKTFHVAATEWGPAQGFLGWSASEQGFINAVPGLLSQCTWLHNP